jgi:hypothetical protein
MRALVRVAAAYLAAGTVRHDIVPGVTAAPADIKSPAWLQLSDLPSGHRHHPVTFANGTHGFVLTVRRALLPHRALHAVHMFLVSPLTVPPCLPQGTLASGAVGGRGIGWGGGSRLRRCCMG